MELLNRSAVIVKPRRPYLEWAERDDDEGLAESVFEVQMSSLVQDLPRGDTLEYIA